MGIKKKKANTVNFKCEGPIDCFDLFGKNSYSQCGLMNKFNISISLHACAVLFSFFLKYILLYIKDI